MNGTSVSNGTRLSPISISQRSFGNFPESFGNGKRPMTPNAYIATARQESTEETNREISVIYLTIPYR